MKKIAVSLAVAFAIVLLIVSMALADIDSLADCIGKEVRVYFKEWAMWAMLETMEAPVVKNVYRKGVLKKVTLKWCLLKSRKHYYWIPVDNIALIEVIK